METREDHTGSPYLMKERSEKQLIERETGEIPLMGQNVNAEREEEQETRAPGATRWPRSFSDVSFVCHFFLNITG